MSRFLYAAAVALLVSFSLSAAPAAKDQPVRIDFRKAVQDGKAVTGWTYKGKFGTADAEFSIQTVDGVKVPTMEEIMMNVENKTGSGVKPNGKYIVPIEVFKNLVKDRALEMGSENAEKLGYPVLDWSKFFGETITPDILSLLMKGLPVLKFNGDGIEFQTKEMFDQALSIVAVKLSSDVFARFVETRKEK